MSQEVSMIMKQMDQTSIEMNLISQCAPLLAGLKTSNLFMIANEQVVKSIALLKQSGISYYFLMKGARKSTFLLYRNDLMSEYLQDSKVQEYLMAAGYQDMRLISMLSVLQKRYQAYRRGQSQVFPHELGIFLGYPLEDILGFIEDGGKNPLYTGYWKVYDHLSVKIRMFQAYEDAKETMIQLLYYGAGFMDVIESYAKGLVIRTGGR